MKAQSAELSGLDPGSRLAYLNTTIYSNGTWCISVQCAISLKFPYKLYLWGNQREGGISSAVDQQCDYMSPDYSLTRVPDCR